MLLLAAALSGQLAKSSDFPEALQAKALEATVRVVHPASHGEGSGVVIRYEGGFVYILTAAHIVPPGPDGDDVEISFFPQVKARAAIVPIKTEVKGRMHNEDLAVIRLGLKEPPPSVLHLCPIAAAPPKYPSEPMSVLALGMGLLNTPEALADKVRLIKLIKKPDGTQALHWEADQEQPVGRSGGALIDTKSRVIGICSGTMNKKGYYLSIYEIHACLTKNGWGFLTKPPVSSPTGGPAEKIASEGKKN
jgi:hypothetical protein